MEKPITPWPAADIPTQDADGLADRPLYAPLRHYMMPAPETAVREALDRHERRNYGLGHLQDLQHHDGGHAPSELLGDAPPRESPPRESIMDRISGGIWRGVMVGLVVWACAATAFIFAGK